MQDYIRLGGFPFGCIVQILMKNLLMLLLKIYNSVVVKDITKGHSIPNIDLFNRVVRFIVENVGKNFSANSIVNFLKSKKRTISVEAIYII